MAVTQGSAPTLSVAVSTSNRITTASFTSDAAGNLTNSGSGVMTYDAENRLVSAAGVTYTYDGDGKRVKKSSGKLYWTGVGSDPLYETDLAGNNQTEYIFFNGKRVARRDPNGSVFYYFSDHLGSASVVTNATGTIVEESDYYPFGGELVITNTDPNQYKFTGKERDTESGLDYFGARYYGSSLGRFTSPDPVGLRGKLLANPQDLNAYQYSINNPIRHIDPNGKDWGDAVEFFKGFARGAVNSVVGLARLGFAAKNYDGLTLAEAGKAMAEHGRHLKTTVKNPEVITQSVQELGSKKTANILGDATGAVVAPAALGTAVGAAARGGSASAATGASTGAEAPAATTTLFRSVGSAEAADIASTGAFRPAPSGSLFKGFFFQASDAEAFAARMAQTTKTPQTVVQAEAPTVLVESSPQHVAATEGPGVLIPKEALPQVVPK